MNTPLKLAAFGARSGRRLRRRHRPRRGRRPGRPGCRGRLRRRRTTWRAGDDAAHGADARAGAERPARRAGGLRGRLHPRRSTGPPARRRRRPVRLPHPRPRRRRRSPTTTVSHDKDLHLIAVRRDLAGFQHVHPALGADGIWRDPARPHPRLLAGVRRLRARRRRRGPHPRRRPRGRRRLRARRRCPAASRTAEVDGYTVTLDGDLAAGEASELTLRSAATAGPVTDLQPYLGAYGHLVALRDGDLAYLHVHPAGEPGDGVTAPAPTSRFATTDAVRRAPTGCSWTSGTATSSAPPRSPCRRRTRSTADDHRTHRPLTDVELLIGGMTCASCAARVEKKLNRLDGVTATVNYATEKAKVSFADGVTTDDLVATVEKTGYTAALPAPPAAAEPARERGRRPDPLAAQPAARLERAADRAGGRAGDGPGAAVRLLAVAVADPGRARSSSGAALPFHRAAWTNLRHGAATMDTLVSLGTLAAFGWSLYALFLGTAGDAGHDAPLRADHRARRRQRQHLPRGRRRGHHVHPGRPLLRGAVQAAGRRGAAGAAGAGRQGRRGAARRRERADPGRPARRRRPVRRPARREDRHRRRGRSRAPRPSTPPC